jgi:hypothetical protein
MRRIDSVFFSRFRTRASDWSGFRDDTLLLPGYNNGMNTVLLNPCTAFNGHRRLASGPLHEVAIAVRNAIESGDNGSVFIYEDSTGRAIDIDTRGTAEEVIARLAHPVEATPWPSLGENPLTDAELRGRGRPKLGVIAREVTLLPRHWDWLNTQPGGASVALRKLVEEARRTSGDKDRTRAAQEAAYHFMSAIAGDLPQFEEATRALFAYDRRRFSDLVAHWPEDVRDHAIKLAFADLDSNGSQFTDQPQPPGKVWRGVSIGEIHG